MKFSFVILSAKKMRKLTIYCTLRYFTFWVKYLKVLGASKNRKRIFNECFQIELCIFTKLNVYMQAHEQAVISAAITLQKFGNNLLMTFIPFSIIQNWESFSNTSTIFIKILYSLWRKTVGKISVSWDLIEIE